jgi:hypothetical protein
VNEHTLQSKCYELPKVHAKFIAPPTLPKKMARFTSAAPRVPSAPTFSDAACAEAAKARLALWREYTDVVDARFKKLRSEGKLGTGLHHHGHEGPHFRRSGVARSTKWHSNYLPNEPAAIGGIGEGHKCFMAVEKCVSALLIEARASAEAAAKVAALYGMPVEAVSAGADHMYHAEHGRASVALSAGDCLLGVLGVFFDKACDSNRVLHAELDSLNLLIDINATQDEFATDTGIVQGWRNTTFGNDFHRSFRNFQTFRMNRPVADQPLVFLDFGDVAHLKTKFGFSFATEEEAYQYTVERLNHLYLAECLKEFLRSKQVDLDRGDLQAEDLPTWTVKVVSDALSVLSIDAKKHLVANNEPFSIAWKCAPWWVVFQLAEANVGASKALLEAVYANRRYPVVMQPLWTHICSHPAFLPHLSTWAEEHDRTATDGNAVSNHVIPSQAWASGKAKMPPTCNVVLPSHADMVNPTLPGQQPAREAPPTDSEASPLPTPSVFSFGQQIVITGGKRAAGCALEGRHDETHKETGCDIYDAVHPASYSFYRGLTFDE